LLSIDTIPILRPGLLILTKIKRAVQYIGSTRPQSMNKLSKDVDDIEFLLRWLRDRNELVDFDGYVSTVPLDRLHSAAKNLVDFLKRTGQDEIVELFDGVLKQEDKVKVMVD
jgi:hypothetical protein